MCLPDGGLKEGAAGRGLCRAEEAECSGRGWCREGGFGNLEVGVERGKILLWALGGRKADLERGDLELWRGLSADTNPDVRLWKVKLSSKLTHSFWRALELDSLGSC